MMLEKYLFQNLNLNPWFLGQIIALSALTFGLLKLLGKVTAFNGVLIFPLIRRLKRTVGFPTGLVGIWVIVFDLLILPLGLLAGWMIGTWQKYFRGIDDYEAPNIPLFAITLIASLFTLMSLGEKTFLTINTSLLSIISYSFFAIVSSLAVSIIMAGTKRKKDALKTFPKINGVKFLFGEKDPSTPLD